MKYRICELNVRAYSFEIHDLTLYIYLLLLNEQKLYIYICLYHVSILKTARWILMKQTLLTSFEDEKAIGLGLDLDKIHLN